MHRRFPRFKGGDPFGLVGPGGVRMLDARTARLWNDVVAELQRLGRWSVRAPLIMRDDRTGRMLGLERTPEMYAKLAGSSPPYSFTEQIYVAGTGWTAGARSGDNAYEVNGATRLDGEVVRLRYEYVSNDWRFSWNRLGCGTPWLITIKAQSACGSANISGVTVALDQGGPTIATGTTNSSGQVSFSVPVGAYNVTATPPTGSGYSTASGSYTFACNIGTTITLAVDSSHVCVACTPCPGAIPTTLNLTTSSGSYTLIYDATQTAWFATSATSTGSYYYVSCLNGVLSLFASNFPNTRTGGTLFLNWTGGPPDTCHPLSLTKTSLIVPGTFDLTG